ncbi:MAG: peptidase MA family metallohydrolase [Nitrospirota bacterium]|nr:peptidase MA family metallohydrolase [Nitrospirota bacterium]
MSLFIILIIPSPPLYAEQIELGIIQNSELIVQFEKPLKNAAKEVETIYPDIKAELEKTLGWRVTFRPTVVLIKDSKTFRKMAGNNQFVAFAVPRKNLIVIDYSKMKTHPFTLEITLRHELCHLLLHHYIREGNLPRWLDEGVSQWVSGGMAEIIMDTRRSPLKDAVLSGRFIPISALTAGFPKDKKSLLLAYEESKSIVEYMGRKYGSNGVLEVLNNLRDGDNVDAAIQKALKIPVQELEIKWHNQLKKRITWFTYLSSNLYEILFFLAALITVAGFIKLLMRKRNYKDEEEEEEEEEEE